MSNCTSIEYEVLNHFLMQQSNDCLRSKSGVDSLSFVHIFATGKDWNLNYYCKILQAVVKHFFPPLLEILQLCILEDCEVM